MACLFTFTHKPVLNNNGYAGLSETALFAIGGILKHARALIAFTNPTRVVSLLPDFKVIESMIPGSR